MSYVDLSPEEESVVLATFDPIAEMAGTDKTKLDELLRAAAFNDETLRAAIGDAAGLRPDLGERQTLEERFVVPPFSILDCRQGYWQARKRAWLSLGIESEVGRSADVGGSRRPAAKASYSGSTARGDGRARAVEQDDDSKTTGSIFDPVLCELIYRWFCPPTGVVLDPFAGGSVRGLIAAQLGRRYLGIDLSETQVAANQVQARALFPKKKDQPNWFVGNSRQLRQVVKPRRKKLEVDLVFSCPPYGDLERYSDNFEDLSTMSARDFDLAYRDIIEEAISCLKTDRFACFVVGDYRAKDGFYRRLASLTIDAFERCGARLYNYAILIQPAASLPMMAAKPFEISRKLGKMHQDVLIFCKGDPKKATAAIGAVEAGGIETETLGGKIE